MENGKISKLQGKKAFFSAWSVKLKVMNHMILVFLYKVRKPCKRNMSLIDSIFIMIQRKKSSFWKKLLLMGEIDERKNKGDLKIEISFILKKKN